MDDYDSPRKAFDFLLARLENSETFEAQELQHAAGWNDEEFQALWRRKLRSLVVDLGEDGYRVSQRFRRFASARRFEEYVERDPHSAAYHEVVHDFLRMYEFFLPLTNESQLRAVLDSLFYRDSVMDRLRLLDQAELALWFPPEGEKEDDYYDRICEWISGRFVGYSIYHVSGRFRTRDLVTHTEAARMPRYLVDETTAVARFIFPCEYEKEALLTGYLFDRLFVQAVVEMVSEEEEIWMTETGMNNRFHVWRVEHK
jgi:hypothetical protein